MSGGHSPMGFALASITRTKKVPNPFCHAFSYQGVAGVQWMRAWSSNEEFVDRPHEPIGLLKTGKLRFCFKFRNKDHVNGKQIRILRGQTEKSRAEWLYEVSVMLYDSISIDTSTTFVESFGVYLHEIYIMNFYQVSTGTCQVTLDATSDRTKPIPLPVITHPGVSSTEAHPIHPTPSGSHVPQRNATDDYGVGSQLPRLSGTSPQAPVASSSGLSTDNDSPYTVNPSHSFSQPTGHGDGTPDLYVNYSHNGGAQGSPGYGNGGHEKLADETDLPYTNSFPGNVQDIGNTTGNVDLYPVNPSHSLPQPTGHGDGIPNHVDYSYNGGAQGSPGYGNEGHEKLGYETDLSYINNDQDIDNTTYNVDPYTGNPSHSLPQPTGHGDGPDSYVNYEDNQDPNAWYYRLDISPSLGHDQYANSTDGA